MGQQQTSPFLSRVESRETVQHLLAQHSSIYQLTATHFDEASGVLSRAFAGTETSTPELFFDWAMGPELSDRADPRRLELTHFFMKWVLSSSLNYGYAFGLRGQEGHLVSVVCTYPPGVYETTWMWFATLVRVGLPPYTTSPSKYGPGVEERFDAGFKQMLSYHAQHASFPHWYIYTLAVDTAAQGKGHGSLLLGFMAALSEAEDRPLYLEASGEKNAAFYCRHGFNQCTERFAVQPSAGQTFQPMSLVGGAFVRSVRPSSR